MLRIVVAFVAGLALGCATVFLVPGEARPPGALPVEPGSGVAADASASLRADRPAAGEGGSSPSTARRTAAQQGGASPAVLDHGPDLGILLYGSVVGTDGAAIDGARLQFLDRGGSERRLNVEVAGNGYALTGLTPGTWRVYGKPEGFVALDREIEVGREPAQRVDLEFRRSSIVTVKMRTPDGTPLHEAVAAARMRSEVVAVATKERPEGDLPMTDLRGYSRYGIGTWRDAHGFVARNGDPAPDEVSGTLELSSAPPVFVSAVLRHRILATAPVRAGQEVVELVVPMEDVRGVLATVSLQVVDAVTGAPVEGARVSISDRQSGGGGSPTDASGRVTLENQPVGFLELQIWAKDREAYWRSIRLESGATDLGVVRLAPASDVRVLAVDAAGDPVPGAQLHCNDLDRWQPGARFRYNITNRTDAEGYGTLRGVGRSRYVVSAQKDDRIVFATLDGAAHVPGEPLRLVLGPSAKVRFGANSATPRTQVDVLTLYGDGGAPVWAGTVRGYAVDLDVPPGRYTWELRRGGEVHRSGSFEARAGQTVPEIALL